MLYLLRVAPLVIIAILNGCNANLKVKTKKAASQSAAPPATSNVESSSPVSAQPVPSAESPATPGENPDAASPINYCYKADAAICAVEKAIAVYTNKQRVVAGLPVLKFSLMFSFAARDWTHQQAEAGAVGHTGFPAARKDVIAKEFPDSGSTFKLIGETAGKVKIDPGAAVEAIAEEMVATWYGSNLHRDVMLSKGADAIGVGIVFKDGRMFATQLLGTDKGALAPP